ncbi:Hypp8875 [Branchiostoma lanceolatum]|uniref:Hypp8875 protein n=1 Tax=Branchiostoma lanceolatum TaxID=7740 RepID=A0A8J9Z9W9_BRALA|nr:Hypp8875 [Branchiostoma lanceolatum]
MAVGVLLRLCCLVWLLTAELPTQVTAQQTFCTVEQAEAWRVAQTAVAPINAMLGIISDANAEIARINAEADAAVAALNSEAAFSQQANVCTGSTTCPCTEQYSQRYSTNCGIFGLGWSTCTDGTISNFFCSFKRYRTSYRETTCPKTTYFCCSGYEYSQSRCIRICTDSLCNSHLCDNDQCPGCVYDHGTHDGKPARAYDAEGMNCYQRCSWRSDSNLCFPGTCERIGSCSCISGFSGSSCTTIQQTPTFMSWLGKLHDNSGGTSDLDQNNQDVWTNKVPTRLEFDWALSYTRPNPEFYSYIRAFKVGIMESKVDWSQKRNTYQTVTSGTINCDMALSNSNPPLDSAIQCINEQATSLSLLHGDEIEVELSAKLGGYFTYHDFDTGQNHNRYFTDGPYTTEASGAKWKYDSTTPTHSGTFAQMLDVGDPFTKQVGTFDIANSPTARWSGWSDTGSGIQNYHVQVYRMDHTQGDELRESFTPWIDEALASSASSYAINMAGEDPGVFSTVMTIEDASGGNEAGNIERTRRFYLYDATSDITIDNSAGLAENGDMWISTTVVDTDYLWQQNLDQFITVEYFDHFIQHTHHNGKFLNAISDFFAAVPQANDDVDTTARSRQAIVNQKGVVTFETSYHVDHEGGTTKASGAWTNVDDLHAGSQSLTISRVDGDTVTVYIRATDILDNQQTDEVSIHIDSTPPIIEDFWLEKNGLEGITVHNAIELYDCLVKFTTYDIHSGLYTISWRLVDMADESIVHGSGNLAVRVESESEPCTADTCKCTPMQPCYMTKYEIVPDASKMDIPLGEHDSDYYFYVDITNRARLVTTERLQITVDISPPEPGHVIDNYAGQPDMNFQSDPSMHFSWEGFFDHESGVRSYQVFFGTRCGIPSDFGIPVPDSATEKTTTELQHSFTASSPGTYYCTVVAFNRALSASDPVCSDGILYDTSPPSITNIVIENIRARTGAIKDGGGNVWMVDDQLRKVAVNGPSSACSSAARQVADPAIFTDRPTVNVNSDLNDDPETVRMATSAGCESDGALASPFFMVVDKHLVVYWNGSDGESQISDYQVGLSTTESGASSPDIMPLTSTYGHTVFKTRHSGLGEGQEFYVSVTATNRAGLSTAKTIGPFVVDARPPTFSGQVTVTLEDDYIVARWPANGFSDDEDTAGLTYEYAVGHEANKEDLLEYTALSSVGPCGGASGCTAIHRDSLQWGIHGTHSYYMSIKATDTAGLTTVATSSAYVHYEGEPTAGVVEDINPDPQAPVYDYLQPADADFQTTATTLSARWSGFLHEHQDISYQVAAGTSAGATDVVGFTSVGQAVEWTRTGLSLSSFQTYYITVKASNSIGDTTVTSDGITVLQDGDALQGAEVIDGLECSNQHDEIYQIQTIRSACYATSPSIYQTSKTAVAAHWSIPPANQAHVTHVQWSIVQEVEGEETVVQDYVNLGMATHGLAVDQDLYLSPAVTYKSKVLFCHQAGCFPPVYSSGFLVAPDPPFPGSLLVTSPYPDSGTRSADIIFDKFGDLYYPTDDVMNFYEWAVADDSENGKLLTDWATVTPTSSNETTISFSVDGLPRDLTKCLSLVVRGHAHTGLSASVSAEIVQCETTSTHRGLNYSTVIDTRPNITLELNADWTEYDIDYTNETTMLSAVWPTLRHRKYEWAVLEDKSGSSLSAMAGHHLSVPNPCDHQDMIECGQTTSEYINVNDLSLEHNKRYIICIHAEETSITYERWVETLPETAVCSSGVTVDVTPPNADAADVWIGSNDKSNYQVSSTELYVQWDGFVDVEEHDVSLHHSGIEHYEYAIGTIAGGNDVQAWTDVGVTDHVLLHGVMLQHGWSYYATVKAVDFVGLSTTKGSQRVTVDTTPPQKSDTHINVGGSFHFSSASVSASWEGVFYDTESGVSFFEWAVGSRAGHADIYPFTRVEETEAETDQNSPLQLHEGHEYYVSVKAYNGAGLMTMATSWAVVVETSPPEAGNVYDGPTSGAVNDRDYQDDVTTIHAHWDGFYDPHSAIVSYTWSVGVCAGCSDILFPQNVGILEAASVDALQLTPGETYYVTVTACNAAALCTTVSSDGVIPDDSPPVAGRVLDGAQGEETSYQASTSSLAAHWYGFNDPHSGLSHYEWRAGTTPGGSDILGVTQLHLTNVAVKTGLSLPVDTMIFITVTAYNHVGMSVETTSNGFRVDTSAPTVTTAVHFDHTHGSLVSATQTWRSAVKIKWRFDDSESLVVDQHVSLSNHHGAEVANIKLNGTVYEYTFTELALNDGNNYVAKVIGCNNARLCTEQQTGSLLIDSSKPLTGHFAVSTDHAARLTRHRDSWMTYDNSGTPTLKLAWLGFSDYHSGIDRLMVAVGTGFYGRDKTLNGAPQVLAHGNQVGDQENDEGYVYTGTVQLSSLVSDYSTLYISLWAINGAGLASTVAHSAFQAVPASGSTGSLTLVRRCDAHSCYGHCICAPFNQNCARPSGNTCTQLDSSDSSYSRIDVYDKTDYSLLTNGDTSDAAYTYSTCALAANWREATIGSAGRPYRYEWSAGLSGQTVGSGLFDLVYDRVWYDVGLETSAVLTLPVGTSLEVGVSYVFYVRAWYTDNIYREFQSNDVRADQTPPKRSSSRKIKDLTSTDEEHDVEYMAQTDSLSVSWEYVFLDAINGGNDYHLERFELALGTYPGGEDVKRFADNVVAGTATSHTFTGLSLQSGKTYYTSVRAYNYAGLHSTFHSDGVMADTVVPTPGVVVDGQDVRDIAYTSDSTNVAASWHGFNDLDSGIDKHFWCIGETNGQSECNVMGWTDTGLVQEGTVTLGSGLTNGQRYYNKVKGQDAAGHQSPVAVSDGYLVDTSPPIPEANLQIGDNLLQNPSFEDAVDGGEGWVLEGDSVVQQISSLPTDDFQTKHGRSHLLLHGSMSQTFTSVADQEYRISFFVNHDATTDVPRLTQEGLLTAPGLHQVFKLRNRQVSTADTTSTEQWDTWQKQIFYFTADGTGSTVTVQSVGTKAGISLDDFKVEPVTYTTTHVNSTAVYEGYIDLTAQTLSDWGSVSAKWSMVDPESPIVDYSWAIGTTRGGTQLQGFVPLGVQESAQNSNLFLQHGSYVHVTVVATNAAELSAVLYSEPALVDLTPPVIGTVLDGSEQDSVDLEYQSSDVICARWSDVIDDESGINYCEWALGTSSHLANLMRFTTSYILEDGKSACIDSSGFIAHGAKVYVIVRCHNHAGQSATASSDGVVLTSVPPSIEHAYVTVVIEPVTQYAPRNHYQYSPDKLHIAWGGFEDPSGISYYEYMVEGPDFISAWEEMSWTGEHTATLTDLQLVPGATYIVSVRSVNFLGMQSDSVSTEVNIAVQGRPSVNRRLQLTWEAQGVMLINWEGVFGSSNADLYYEVSLGLVEGGSKAGLWYETKQTNMTVSSLDQTKEYHITVNAITNAGMYITVVGRLEG